MRKALIFGSTGSIGTQAIEVLANQSFARQSTAPHIEVYGIVTGGNSESSVRCLAEQVQRFRPQVVGVSNKAAFTSIKELLASQNITAHIVAGETETAELALELGIQDVVLNGVTGAAGLYTTLHTLTSGATLALANKESLVVGGAVVKATQKRPGQVVPVDSEHCAIFQAILSGKHEKGMCAPVVTGQSEIKQIILTASGGPFRGKARADLKQVTKQQALAHPTWNMGPVVTINSSTLMNKALELIEAHLLFAVDPQDICAVVHPQSIIHSGVTWQDGNTILQASVPDMRLPISIGLAWPHRVYGAIGELDFSQLHRWEFEPVDNDTFPVLNLARFALQASPTHPAVMNAANEVCVEAFLQDKIGYLDIIDTVEQVVEVYEGAAANTVDDVIYADTWARRKAQEILC